MKRSVVIVMLVAIAAVAAIARARLESSQGLRADYTVERQGGADTRSRIDRDVSTAALHQAWHNIPPERYRVRWTGLLIVSEGGLYTIATTSDDGSTLTLDGVRLVDNGGRHPPQTRSGRARLPRGAHQVVVEYEQLGGDASIQLLWAREQDQPSEIPWWRLWTAAPGTPRLLAARVIDPIPSTIALLAVALLLWEFWARMPAGSVRRLRPDWALLLIVAFGAYFRLQYVGLPMAEAHSWRQITNADIARNFAEGSLNILYPSVSWGGGGEAYVGMEFPLLQWTAGALFRIYGEHDVICRAIAIAFSLATCVGLWGLGRLLWGAAVGRAAAFMYAISPSAIFFGRAFISDTPMVCFSVFGVWGFASYVKTGKTSSLIWGTVTTALACMVKVPAVIIFAPIAWLGWEARRWAVLRDWRLIGGMAVALAFTIAWYVHADTLFHQTGLGEAIWHPSGAYSPDIMEVAGPTLTVSHWATAAQLKDPEFYTSLLQRFWHLHFTPIVTVVLLIGAVTQWRVPHRLMIDAWFATVVLFILVSAEGNRWHEFHQMPILLPSALYFALAAWPVFDAGWLRRPAPLAVSAAVAAAALVWIGVTGVNTSRVVPEYFRPFRLSLDPVNLGHRINDATPPGSLVITVEYPRYGGNSPILLYHARRRGWSFDVEGITPAVIEKLRDQYGASYFATTIWSQIVEAKPDVAKYLESRATARLDASRDTAIFQLR